MEYLVDILMPAYNHELYIGDALDGVVSQQTNFKFRLLIAEDCSTDGTKAIIEQYRIKHPEIIIPFYREKNLGAYENSRLLFKEMKAKYIALCEGDDYWSDRNKLQAQIDILEAHPEYVGCFHNTEERYEDEDAASFLYCSFPSACKLTFKELSYANHIPTCSVLYKRDLFVFPKGFHELKMGDWPMHLLNAQFGDYWYIPKVMAVHRLHKKSIWMLQNRERNSQYVVEAYDAMIGWFSEFDNLKKQLELAKAAYIAPPLKPTFVRKGINLARKIKSRLR